MRWPYFAGAPRFTYDHENAFGDQHSELAFVTCIARVLRAARAETLPLDRHHICVAGSIVGLELPGFDVALVMEVRHGGCIVRPYLVQDHEKDVNGVIAAQGAFAEPVWYDASPILRHAKLFATLDEAIAWRCQRRNHLRRILPTLQVGDFVTLFWCRDKPEQTRAYDDRLTVHTCLQTQTLRCSYANQMARTPFFVGDWTNPFGVRDGSHGSGWRWVHAEHVLEAFPSLELPYCDPTLVSMTAPRLDKGDTLNCLLSSGRIVRSCTLVRTLVSGLVVCCQPKSDHAAQRWVIRYYPYSALQHVTRCEDAAVGAEDTEDTDIIDSTWCHSVSASSGISMGEPSSDTAL
ncbi:Hypothetical protein UVM_LOCUS257 [uncultured virus]|nr:Hypothetical protein UVM_LOCUS257 [uncultured virus]